MKKRNIAQNHQIMFQVFSKTDPGSSIIFFEYLNFFNLSISFSKNHKYLTKHDYMRDLFA